MRVENGKVVRHNVEEKRGCIAHRPAGSRKGSDPLSPFVGTRARARKRVCVYALPPRTPGGFYSRRQRTLAFGSEDFGLRCC